MRKLMRPNNPQFFFLFQSLPDMKDQEAVQKFFLEEVNKGEECLGRNDFDSCVKHLTNAIAVCGQPQQLLQVFRQTLPPNVFQMLVQNLATLGSAQIQQMVSLFCDICFYRHSISEVKLSEILYSFRSKNSPLTPIYLQYLANLNRTNEW